MSVKNSFSKYQLATAITVLFHGIGLAGMLWFNEDYFIRATGFNLLLSFGLLLWTQHKISGPFLGFFIIVFLSGIAVEVVGVNTGALFGDYQYGTVLGWKFRNVPLIIGVNWFVIIYCCGISIHTLLMKAIRSIALDTGKKPMTLKALSVIIDGATLAVFFDWLMEPVAVKLGYWKWAGTGAVPFYNYLSWFVVSVVLLTVFHFCNFDKQNKFAVNLLLVQGMFFLLLRTFLK